MSMIGNYLRISPALLERLRQDPSDITTVLYPNQEHEHPEGIHLDIDKAWHAIQFLLTGDPWKGAAPLQNAVMGGTELGEEDVGYGPARSLSAAEVQAVAQALGSISGEQLWSRFDAQAFSAAEIYPQGWESDGREYVVGNYDALRAFFRDAARSGDAMILYLS
ncbi:MAG TPA: YfbM family protein [Polyangiaceae bacterium]|nr:YfbM family protein [Polyangiaceae bacterium]